MKILHIVHSVTGGAGIAALNLHNTLNQIEGIESFIIEKMDPSVIDPNITTIYENKNIFYRLKRKLGLTPEVKNRKLIPMFPRHNEYEIATFPTSSYRLEDLDIVKQVDIIHLHWISNFVNYPTFFKNIKKPIVWTIHDRNPFSGIFHTKLDLVNNQYLLKLDTKTKNIKKNSITKNDNISFVFPSLWMLNESNENEVFNKYPKYCIPNSVDCSYVFDRDKLRKEFNIDNNKKNLLFIAHSIDIPRRGFYIMKEVLKNIHSDNYNLITVGGEKIDLENEKCLHIHFKTTSNRELIHKIYSVADVQILPTLEDNLPNVMLESFACGTPVISFSNGGMAEHITTGENGILIDEIGSDPLKNAILDFLNDKYIFDRAKIRQYAEEHFSSDTIASKYKDLYINLLKV